MRRGEAKEAFKTEADLCASFIAWAEREGWKAYAETAGWDILLVNSAGHQLGIQAKLRLNWKVIDQALPSLWYADDRDEGPNHRGLLVPVSEDGAAKLFAAAGLQIFSPNYKHGGIWEFCNRASGDDRAMFDWNPKKLHTLPDYVPDVVAGASGPVQLTPWKIGALRLLAKLELQGYVERADFRVCGIDSRRWCGTWLHAGDEGGRWVRGNCPPFAEQHPIVYAQILAEARAKRVPRGDMFGGTA